MPVFATEVGAGKQYAAAVLKEEEIVGHMPYNLAPAVSQFLKRDVNKGFVQVIGSKINRVAGYGLEVPEFTDSMD